MSETQLPPAKPPEGLIKTGRRDGPGRKLWKSITVADDGKTARYVLRPDELRILEDACMLADKVHRYEARMEGQSETVRGSQGQQVLHPLLGEIRQCRTAIAGQLAKLKLPEDSAGATPRSVSARAAAQSRWGTTG